ncbi:MAG TPA: outer membrane beta-barrel protein [Candidatus Limnocylindrales bacterium]|nr:outer membrane beta-barrel protein [Candidatus Limnocylindrales bacterium]
MRFRFFSIAILAFIFTVPALAQQEQPPFDVFAGYSHSSNFDTGLNGWIFSGNYDFSQYLGVEGDFSGHYGSHGLGGLPILLPGVPSSVNTNMYNYNFGPRFTWRSPEQPFNVFGHLLFGGGHASISAPGVASQSDSSYTWVLGGGADYNFNNNWAGRAQFDYLHTNFFSNGEGHPRISFGIVYRLGGSR